MLAKIRAALDNIRSDDVTYDFLEGLAREVEALRDGDVKAVARALEVLGSARTKKAAAEAVRVFLRNQKQVAYSTRF